MKHTDISSELSKLQFKEQNELIAALKAHDNVYTWLDLDDQTEVDYDDYENYEAGDLQLPCVTVLPKYDGRSYELVVCEAFTNDKGEILLTGFEADSSDLDVIDCEGSEVMLGHLGLIIDMIPETPDIKDVSPVNDEYPISCLSRDDLEDRGYDVSQVSDETMKRLAKRLGDAYCENSFWIDLDIIADYLEIPKLEKK